MNEVIRKELIEIISKTIAILETKEEKDVEELKTLSDQAVESVALHKNLDIVSITVLVYSLYKTDQAIPSKDHQEILKELKIAKDALQQRNFGKYNRIIKLIYNIVKNYNIKVKEHLDDVMHAAKIKKGAVLLQKGLSLGQAAGLMGLSNWDLQEYAGKTTALEPRYEAIPAKKRMITALKLFK